MDVRTTIDEERANTLQSRHPVCLRSPGISESQPPDQERRQYRPARRHLQRLCAAFFPGGQFYSVDFQTKLKEQNSLLPQSLNWTFASGYPLAVIRSGHVKVDMYFCVSTSVMMNNKELKRISRCNGDTREGDCRLRKVGGRRSKLCGHIIPPGHVERTALLRRCIHNHNYVAKFEQRGFKSQHSQIMHYSEAFHYLQLIAAR
jgi:hypothetical protein